MRYMLSMSLFLLALAGCSMVGDFVRAVEPLLDVAAQTAADSAALQVGAQVPDGVDPATVIGGTSAAIMSIYALIKAGVYAWNRKPA